jgi:chromosome segregation ATPase
MVNELPGTSRKPATKAVDAARARKPAATSELATELAETRELLALRTARLPELQAALFEAERERDTLRDKVAALTKQLTEREADLVELGQSLFDLQGEAGPEYSRDLKLLRKKLAQVQEKLDEVSWERKKLLNSTSWRITRPLRRVARLMSGRKSDRD